MTWLVTGGAGYIGSHVVRAMHEAGLAAVIVDDLSTGHAARLADDDTLIRLSLQDVDALRATFRASDVDGVVHLAAKKDVSESLLAPTDYWHHNVGGLTNLLAVMAEHGITRLVYSSSAAVYGAAAGPAIAEDTVCAPTNPYGQTKLEGERLVAEYARDAGAACVALRYFNVAGAASGTLGDHDGTNLVQRAVRAAADGTGLQIFGTDYPTPDGTCIRDYVHVEDVASAHLAAMAWVDGHGGGFTPLNVGTGHGSSVLQVIAAVSASSGRPIVTEAVGRRQGDPPVAVADVGKAASMLGWRSRRTLEEMVASAWSAHTPLACREHGPGCD